MIPVNISKKGRALMNNKLLLRKVIVAINNDKTFKMWSKEGLPIKVGEKTITVRYS